LNKVGKVFEDTNKLVDKVFAVVSIAAMVLSELL